jgi:hypothetical protein
MRRLISFLMAVASLPAAAQTQVDLRTQSKSVDFTAASSTRPLKTGASLPATCTLGEMFFKTDAPAGMNVYGCTAGNTWTLQGGGGGGGFVTIENDGTVVGARPVENFVHGAGLVTAISDTGTKVNIQQSVDTAVMQSKASEQSGATLLCASAGGSPTEFTCAMNPTLGAYTTGMMVHWRPDVNGSGGATTMNIDTLGVKGVKLADGVTDPTAADLVAGRLYAVWFDGTYFRIQAAGGAAAATGTRPACDTAQRGRIWQVFGDEGVKDEFAVCAKDAAGEYAWRVLY